MTLISTSSIVGITAIAAACVATFVVYLVITKKPRPKGAQAPRSHNYLPDMAWYRNDPDLYDALFMTFAVGLWIGSSLPQLITNSMANSRSEVESVDPFFITLVPPALAGKVPGFRHVLANNIKLGISTYAITIELVGILLGMVAFIVWMYQYSIPLYNSGTNMALASSLIGIATFYSVAWIWLVYWIQSIHHHVSPAYPSANLETKGLLSVDETTSTFTVFGNEDEFDNYNPFEGSSLGEVFTVKPSTSTPIPVIDSVPATRLSFSDCM